MASSTSIAVALALAVGAGYLIGRDGNSAGPVRTGPGAIALANSALRIPSDCDTLLDSYIDRGLDTVTAYGWDDGVAFAYDMMPGAATSMESGPSARGTAPTTVRSTNNETGTNVQESGVDEPDLVKVSGDRLFRVQDNVLKAYDISGEGPKQLSSLEMPDLHDAEILLSGDRVVVLGSAGPRYGASKSRVLLVDMSDPTTPTIVTQNDYDATTSAARLHGDVVRVVLDSGLPDLDFRFPSPRRSEGETLERNRDLVRATTLSDWVPSLEGEPIVECADVAIPTMDTQLGTTTIVTFRPAAAEPVTSAVATSATTSYFSPDRFYLAAANSPTGWWRGPVMDCLGLCPDGGNDGNTELFAFALDGTDTTYVAAGDVKGQIRDRWSMDYANGALRVALGQTSQTGNFNSVVTMREDDGTLSEVGRVDKLGVDEDIKSVRWFDDLAIVVTFRQVDPLYAIDLSDPKAPALMGKLKIPGFSEYLHPLGERRLIGVGQDVSRRGSVRGAQAALFDVTDLTSPRRLDVVAYPKFSQAGAGLDPRQFTWLPEARTALTVVSKGWTGRTAWVSVLSLEGGSMSNRMVEVAYGEEIDQVRLVPIADGRVVLITGDDVSFFDV